MLDLLESWGWAADGALTSAPSAGRWSSIGPGWSIVSPGHLGVGKILNGVGGSGGSGSSIIRDVVNRTDIIVGTRVRFNNGLPAFGTICEFGTLGGFGANGLMRVVANAAGEIIAYRNTEGDAGETDVIATSTDHITAGNFHYIEAYAVFSKTAGVVKLAIDGNVVASVTGVNTHHSTFWGPTCSQIKFDAGFADDRDYCDMYFANLATGQITDFMGDTKVGILLPTADFAKTLTPSAGTVNALMVDEIGPDEDATFNFTDQPTGMDEFDHQGGVAATSIIRAVQVTARGRKTDVATRLIEPTIRSNGILGTAQLKSLATIHRHRYQAYELDPDGSVAWAPAKVNGAKIGYRLSVP